ncbi:hypothetical protein ACFPTO_22640 [Paraburkholderia denitrificans]|uniref:Uncharacterized protein n=1 Tax=Paraburkholderia denitrificans TaxID=694025 RepID=A0ABW0JFD7_9BURK
MEVSIWPPPFPHTGVAPVLTDEAGLNGGKSRMDTLHNGKRILADVEQAEAEATAAHANPAGKRRVYGGTSFGQVPAALAEQEAALSACDDASAQAGAQRREQSSRARDARKTERLRLVN